MNIQLDFVELLKLLEKHKNNLCPQMTQIKKIKKEFFARLEPAREALTIKDR